MYMVYLITLIFIVLDFASGIVKALKNKNVSSQVLREGLFHKMAYIILVVLAVLIEQAEGLVIDSTIPVVIPACAYIVFTEITSILENVTQINPEILPEKLASIFASFTDKEG